MMDNLHGKYGVRKKRSIRKRFKWVKGTMPPGWRIWNTDKDGYWTTKTEKDDTSPVDYWWWNEFTGTHPMTRMRWPVR